MNLDFSKPRFTPEKVAYYTFGKGEQAIVLVHGSFGSGMMWLKQIPVFLNDGFKVVSIDLQGHGNSKDFDLSKTTMDDYANNIRGVLKTIVGHSVLVGHSMSGLTVLMAAGGLEQITRVVSIDPSPSREVQGVGSAEAIPDTYTPMQAGMPGDPEGMKTGMPDIDPQMFGMISKMFGPESGAARRQRKLGISIPKEKLDSKQILFLGAELGDSLPFGIPASSTKKMAEFYNKEYIEIHGASHPGMLMGNHAEEVAQKIIKWLENSRATLFL